jgi:hypothetical protein
MKKPAQPPATQPPTPDELLEAEEVAPRLRVSPRAVKGMARRGEIPSVWLSARRRRFNWPAVAAAIEARGGKVPVS